MTKEMSIKKLLWLFLFFYLGGDIVLGFIQALLKVSYPVLDYVITFGALLILLASFAKKNARYLDKIESKKVFWGTLSICALLSLIIGSSVSILLLHKELSQPIIAGGIFIWILSEAFRAIVIHLTIKYSKKRLIKRGVITLDNDLDLSVIQKKKYHKSI